MTAELGRFEFDPTSVTASIEVFPKGEYEFLVGAPKAFLKQAGEDKHDSFGIRYPLTIKLPDQYDGKKTFFSTYYQSDGAQSMAKQFIMATLGYGKSQQEEERFDRDMKGQDWSFTPNDGSVGDMYKQLQGKRVIGSLDTMPNKNKPGEVLQQFGGWRSITSGPLAK